MRGWIKSNNVRANNHWQSGTNGIANFDILLDKWHSGTTVSGNKLWMVNEDDDNLKALYQLEEIGGGVIWLNKASPVGIYQTPDCTSTKLAYLYNRRDMDGLDKASKIYIKCTCLTVPEELKNSTFKFSLSSVYLKAFTSALSFKGVGYTYNIEDKEVYKTTTYGYKYVIMNGANDSVTYSCIPEKEGTNLMLLGGALYTGYTFNSTQLFIVGCDTRTLTGTWKWKIEVTI